jgi:AcrR family transcriptional regulator
MDNGPTVTPGGLVPEDHREQLLSAAASIAARTGPARVRFAEVIERSGVARATAYRIFPRGYESVLMSLHEELVEQTVVAIRNEVRAIGRQIEFGDAVGAGVRALLQSLGSGRLTSRFLKSDPDLLTFYLLSRSPGSLLDVLATYAEGCAATYGSLAADLHTASQNFVWGVLVDVVDDRQHGADWPDAERLRQLLDGRIQAFLNDAQLCDIGGEARLDCAITPLAGVPDEYGDMHFVVMSTP